MAEENTPAAPAPTGESVADNPNTNTNTTADAPAPSSVDLGLTDEQAQQFKTFIDNSGGFEKAFSRVKSAISNPEKVAEPVQPAQENPTSHTQAPVEPQFKTPEGAITAQEFLAKQYFQSLAGEEKYQAISNGIANGDYLKEMSAFGINALNPDGSINDQKVRMYLDLKAQTVPAKGTGTEPDASAAPTVEYYQVQGDEITQMDDAYKILQQDMQLQAAGQGHHPRIQEAENFIKNKGQEPEEKK